MGSYVLPRRFPPRVRVFIVFGIYLLLTVLITWPAIGRLGVEIPDLLGDGYVHLWTFDWLKRSFAAGTDPLFTSQLFFPVGASLANHNIAWFHFLLWLPLQALVGGSAAFTVVFLINYPLTALTTFLLVRRVTGSAAAAFIGGLVAGFWPYNISHHSHPNLIAIWWVPLILMALEDLFAHRRYRYAVLVGVLVGLLGITRWQLLIISGILLGMALLWHLAHCPRRYWPRVFLLLSVAGLIATLLMTPFFLPVLRYQATRGNPEELLVSDEEAYGSDLASYLLPSRYHPLWGPTVMRFIGRFAGNAVYVRFIGFVTLLLALLGAVAQWRKALFWTIAALIYFIISLGSPLYVLGRPYWTMPYSLLENSFAFQLVRFPDRFNVMLAIPVAVLAGLGVAWLLSRIRPRPALAVAVLVGVLIVVEYLVAYPMLPLTTPPWYATLSQSDETFGLLDVPICPQAEHNKRYMFYQLQHDRPLVQGHISRPSREMFAFIDSVPLLSQINCRLEAPSTLPNVSEQMRLLASSDVPYLILHKEYLKPKQLNAWREWLVAPPIFEDSLLVVYATEAAPADAIPWSHSLLTDDRQATILGLVNSTAADTPTERMQGDWLVTAVTWRAAAGPIAEMLTCIDLIDANGRSAQQKCYPLSDDWPAARWQDGEIVREEYPLQIAPFLSPGPYGVSLSLRDAAGGQPLGQSAVVGVVEVSALPRQFDPPFDAAPLAAWNDEIALVSYNLLKTPSVLRLALYWQTDERIDNSYKLFVHVTDRATGALIAQEDRVPGNWMRPTYWWEAGEYVAEVVRLPSQAAADGYDIWVGWYNPDSGERLPISQSAPDQVVVDNRLLLDWAER